MFLCLGCGAVHYCCRSHQKKNMAERPFSSVHNCQASTTERGVLQQLLRNRISLRKLKFKTKSLFKKIQCCTQCVQSLFFAKIQRVGINHKYRACTDSESMYIIREDTVFHEILDSVQTRFWRNRVCTKSCFGSVPTLFWECTDRLQPKTGHVQTLNAFFQNFVPSKYRPCTVRFSTRLPHGYRVTESKKCLYRVSGNVHCRYIVGTLPVLLGIDPV